MEKSREVVCMSGGSFNYLCFVDTMEEIFRQKDDLKEMIEFLKEGKNKWTKDISSSISVALMEDLEHFEKTFEEKWKRWKELLHAVEWYVSGDWGWERVMEEFKRMIDGKD